MSHGSNLGELERLHTELEREIAEAMSHRGWDTLTITELKRRKLQLKDAISRLRTAETVH